MKRTIISWISRRTTRLALLGLVAALMMAACTGQPQAAGTQVASALPATGLPAEPLATDTEQPGQEAIPQTGAGESAVTETAAVETGTTEPAAEEPAAAEAVPNCTPPAALTPAMTEGPYWKADSPERTSLIESGTVGTPLTLTGYVLTADCQPVPGAWLDFWQTDGNGEYDNAGFGMRGHQFTDEQGRYRLESVVPGLYPGRTAHIHVKVQAPGGPELTSQLFVPGEPGNESDRIFDPALLMDVQEGQDGVQATFNFFVATGQ